MSSLTIKEIHNKFKDVKRVQTVIHDGFWHCSNPEVKPGMLGTITSIAGLWIFVRLDEIPELETIIYFLLLKEV